MSQTWLEIAVKTASGYVDELAGIISAQVPQASAGLEVREAEVAFWVVAGDETAALESVRALVQRLADSGAPVDADGVELKAAPPEDEWREAYKKYFRADRLTRQIVVVPSWESYEAKPDDLVLHLDPGQAFGTGSHATTTLVLRELQRLADGGLVTERSLDAGTGSGILTIGIAKLGLAAEQSAFDNDPLAVSAARENCERNDVGADVWRGAAPKPDDAPFGLIVANIQRGVLIELADKLSNAAGESAHLVLSGLLSHQLDEVSEAYQSRGWSETRREIDDNDSEWGVLTLVRR